MRDERARKAKNEVGNCILIVSLALSLEERVVIDLSN